MKNSIKSNILVFFIIALILIILATSGFETDKFNKLISEKVIQSNKDIYFVK